MKKLFNSKKEYDNYMNYVVICISGDIDKFHTKRQAEKYLEDNGIRKGYSILTKKQYENKYVRK